MIPSEKFLIKFCYKLKFQLEGEDEDGDDPSNMSRSAQDSKKTNSSNRNEADGGNAELLSLEDMSFTSGSHFMANKRCQLPEGSFRRQEKGYEEVHVPALKPKTFANDEQVMPFIIEFYLLCTSKIYSFGCHIPIFKHKIGFRKHNK
jgi:pre-mRNA-splicing helicase BRR2